MVNGYKVFWHIRSVFGWSQSVLAIQWSPLVWSTDVRSIRLYGQFLASPERMGILLVKKHASRSKNPACKVNFNPFL